MTNIVSGSRPLPNSMSGSLLGSGYIIIVYVDNYYSMISLGN